MHLTYFECYGVGIESYTNETVNDLMFSYHVTNIACG